MKNDMNYNEFFEGFMEQMIQVVEFQTAIGTKLQSLEKEIKGMQDSLADIHEAVTTRYEK